MTYLGSDIAIWDLGLCPLDEASNKALRPASSEFPSGTLTMIGAPSPGLTDFRKAWSEAEEAGSKLAQGLSTLSDEFWDAISSDLEFLEDEVISLEDYKQCYEDYYGVEVGDLDSDYEFIEGPPLGILKGIRSQPELHNRSPPGYN